MHRHGFRPGQVPANCILDLYRFLNPTIWFINLKPEVPSAVLQTLHDKKVDLANHGVTIDMGHLDKQTQRLTIHWLPSSLLAEGAMKLVEATTGNPDGEVFKFKDLTGSCGGGGEGKKKVGAGGGSITDPRGSSTLPDCVLQH